MRGVATALLCVCLFILVLKTSATGDGIVDENKYIILLEKDAKDKEVRDVDNWLKEKKYKTKKMKRLKQIIVDGKLSKKRIERLKKKKKVKAVVPDLRLTVADNMASTCVTYTVATADLQPQDMLDGTDNGYRAYSVDNNPMSSRDLINIYVIDTGIKADHESFREVGSTRSRVTRIHDGHPNDSGLDEHGTNIGGLAAAKTYGAADYQSLIMDVRVYDEHGGGTVSDITTGIDEIVDHHVLNATDGKSVIVCALVVNKTGNSAESLTALEDAVDAATGTSGLYFAAAAGNDGLEASDIVPCSYDDVICVGAVNDTDDMTLFSNWGTKLDILTYGKDIQTPGVDSTTDIDKVEGTSAAVGFVGGVIAYYLADDVGNVPSFNTVQNHLVNNAVAANSLVHYQTGTPDKVMRIYPTCTI